MRGKITKKSKKKNRKKRKAKTYSKKKANGAALDLQKVVDFKFQMLGNFYKNFSKKRKKEKDKLEK